MTDLSPAAQAVLHAANLQPRYGCHASWIAAALRALADQVACQIPDDCSPDAFNRQLKIRAKILAIAAELEGKQ